MTEFRVSRGECDATNAELNVWTAEKVMGWTLNTEGFWVMPDGTLRSQWEPTTDMNHAYELVQAMRLSLDNSRFKLGFFMGYSAFDPHAATPWKAAFFHEKDGSREEWRWVHDDELPRAICISTLLAVIERKGDSPDV